MRIAIVGTELCAVDARGGGLERVLLRWAEHLGSNHDVAIVSVDRPAELPTALRRIAPDLVSLHNRPQWSELVPGPARCAVTFHNYPAAWMVERADAPRLPPIPASAVSGALARAAEDLLGRRVGVTPPSIDPAFVEEADWLPEPVVLSPNRLLRKKGVEGLLAVAGRPEFASTTFAFADLISPWARPTAEHHALRAAIDRVPNAVRFPAARSAADLAERYRRSAVVACPVTEEEGLGLVALEAQACGVPLVSVDLGGLREATFPPNRCVPPADPDALAEALRLSFGRDPTAGEGPRRAVLARHSPAVSGAAFEAWLEDVAAGDVSRGC